MTHRRDILKGLAGLGAFAFVSTRAFAAPAKVRVTLVRWPYT